MSSHTRYAVGGFVLLLPVCTLVSSGLLGLHPPDALVHPLVLLVSLAASLLLNLSTFVSGKVRCKNGIILGGIAIQVERRLLNLAVVACGLVLLGTIALYLFIENFALR